VDDAAVGDSVVLQKLGPVAIMRLNRPHRLNAFTAEMAGRIIATFDECDSDDSVRAVVLTGTGRAFCAGADLENREDTIVLHDAGTGEAPPDEGGRVSLRIFRSTKPVIAAVSVAMTRQLMWRMLGAAGPEVAHQAESTAIFSRGRSLDVREGVAAFLDKRAPVFPESVSTGLHEIMGRE
jgi:enoyl-CoA hydratase/carnithine racemase